jgi:DNA-binding MarR family transcriptional regulator
MVRDLSRSLHAVTARADRAAERILRTERQVSLSRFLLLYAISELGGASQRALADRLGVTEPSTSRMVRSLSADGLVAVTSAAGGNRRRVELTVAGRALLEGCGELLEDRFAEVVDRAGVDYDEYRRSTVRLLAALGGKGDAEEAAGAPAAAGAVRP